VPYLRDRDIRVAEVGESIDDKERKLIEGIQTHYLKVCELAEHKRKTLAVEIPIIAMGHLFTAGGQTIDGDGVRELYVGSLAHVASGIFPECIDYLALGHLHVPQIVNGSDVMRYSGSPLPMGFGEAKQEKSVCLLEFTGKEAKVALLTVPVFKRLERIRGEWDEIAARLLEISASQSDAWLEIVYEGEDVAGDLRERVEALSAGTLMDVLRIKNNRVIERVLNRSHDKETLDDLNVNDVFERCLVMHGVSEDQRPELLRAYQETITSLYEDDVQAQ
jgi:exonuclease SbcD